MKDLKYNFTHLMQVVVLDEKTLTENQKNIWNFLHIEKKK